MTAIKTCTSRQYIIAKLKSFVFITNDVDLILLTGMRPKHCANSKTGCNSRLRLL